MKNQRNTTVILGEVGGINKDARFVYASNEDRKDVALGYDILVIATGVTHSYFGHDEFAEFAPGLKGLADAVRTRNSPSRTIDYLGAVRIPLAPSRIILRFCLFKCL